MSSSSLSDVGLYGLAVMGENFALNMASKGFRVSVSNRSPSKVDATVARAESEGHLPIVGFKDAESFVNSIAVPRKIILLVQAGTAVDDTIALLSQFMQAGDVIADGGNEWYPNSIRRAALLQAKGIYYIGMGISGGEEGARTGPSIMPGGELAAYELLEPIISRCAAQVDDGPCTFYVGPIGAGNYVKMVHNGIEYGDMQLIAEVYDVMKHLAHLDNGRMAQVFRDWNQGELESFLIEITATILDKKDDLGDVDEAAATAGAASPAAASSSSSAASVRYVTDVILDKTGMKGTGRWTIQEAAERSVSVPTIAAALDARYLSGRRDERVAASTVLQGPTQVPQVDSQQIVDDCRHALYASKICSYAQGMCLIRAASDQMHWNIDVCECARIWKGGCIIRAAFLGRIQAAYQRDQHLPNLMVDPSFAADLNRQQGSWRRIVSLCVASGIACPALSASLAYFDSCRRERLPANLTQVRACVDRCIGALSIVTPYSAFCPLRLVPLPFALYPLQYIFIALLSALALCSRPLCSLLCSFHSALCTSAVRPLPS